MATLRTGILHPVMSIEVAVDAPCLGRLEAMRGRLHSRCFACRALPFRLEFEVEADGVLVAAVNLDASLCSYDDTIHGGLLGLLFDETAVCCLFARGIEAVTVDLQTRFRYPVRPGVGISVRGELIRSRGHLHSVRMWMEQAQRVVATAKAEMWKPDGRAP